MTYYSRYHLHRVSGKQAKDYALELLYSGQQPSKAEKYLCPATSQDYRNAAFHVDNIKNDQVLLFTVQPPWSTTFVSTGWWLATEIDVKMS